jgi:endonuclease/exonuclease/phosphatase family metal-dependent hydrolase
MAFSFRILSKRFFVAANVAVVGLFLMACLQPWLNPETFWLVSFMSLSFPLGLLGVVLFLLLWLVLRKWRLTLISLIALGLGWQQIDVLFSLESASFHIQKKPNHLRILNWNVRGFSGLQSSTAQKEVNLDRIFELLAHLNPDVICFQEFGQYSKPGLGEDYTLRLEKLGYKHHVLSNDYSRAIYQYTNGLAIFSKLPMVATKRVPFTSSPESLLYADLSVPGAADTIRVYTTHLQSFKFNGTDYAYIEQIKTTDDKLVAASKNIFAKMKRAFRNRGQQADMIRPLIDSCPYPEVLGCDMNDVPTSYAYWKLRGKRIDAFLEKGYGIGRTYLGLSPTLRIDYLLADERLQVAQFCTINKPLSDHLPLVMDIVLP